MLSFLSDDVIVSTYSWRAAFFWITNVARDLSLGGSEMYSGS